MDRNAIVCLGVDLNRGIKSFSFEDKTYSAAEAVEVLRQSLIEANGGSATIDYKSVRRNKAEIFEIVEEIIPAIVNDGLNDSDFWNTYVDYRNLKFGDKNEFYIEDADFVVTTIADGIATPRRQRLLGTTVSVETSIHAIRIYDEFSRFMAGRIDWDALCEKVAAAFQKAIWADIFTAFTGYTGYASYSVTGSSDADSIIDVINDIEAATGKGAVIFGTQPVLKKISDITVPNGVSSQARDDIYQKGYYGKFYGTPCFKIDKPEGAGTSADKTLYIIGADDKFIKFVNEGDTIIDDRNWSDNADMTIEYRVLQKWGVGITASSKGVAKYTFA